MKEVGKRSLDSIACTLDMKEKESLLLALVYCIRQSSQAAVNVRLFLHAFSPFVAFVNSHSHGNTRYLSTIDSLRSVA